MYGLISVGNFAVFNVADASITVGVAVMLIALWQEEKKNSPKSA
jgi:signal peptidase II